MSVNVIAFVNIFIEFDENIKITFVVILLFTFEHRLKDFIIVKYKLTWNKYCGN